MKSIEIDEDVFDRLMRAKLPGESLSELLDRQFTPARKGTGLAILQSLRARAYRGELLTEEMLDALDADQEADEPPPDKWATS